MSGRWKPTVKRNGNVGERRLCTTSVSPPQHIGADEIHSVNVSAASPLSVVSQHRALYRSDTDIHEPAIPTLYKKELPNDPYNTHAYDGQIPQETYDKFRKVLQTNDVPSFQTCAAEAKMYIETDDIKAPSEKQRVLQGIAAFERINPIDPVNNLNCHDTFRVAWFLCRNDSSMRDLFYLMQDDMIRTSGTCAQGRSIRMMSLIY